MQIEDRPNLNRIKRALFLYKEACSNLRIKLNPNHYDAELIATDELIKIVDDNLKKIDEDINGG